MSRSIFAEAGLLKVLPYKPAPVSRAAMAAISNFIKNTKLQRQIVQNIARQDFAGPSEVIKIYSILNNSQS